MKFNQLACGAALAVFIGAAPGIAGCRNIYPSKSRPVAKATPKKVTAYERKESDRLYQRGLEAYLANKYGTAELLWRDSLDYNYRNQNSQAALKKVVAERKALKLIKERQNSD